VGQDYYAEAREIAAAIRAGAETQVERANQIEEAISAGFTATEILMGVRFRLRELLGDQRVSLPAELAESAGDLAAAIDEALGA